MFFNAPIRHILKDLHENIQTPSCCCHFVLNDAICSLILLCPAAEHQLFPHTPAEHMNVTRIQAKKKLKYQCCEFHKI